MNSHEVEQAIHDVLNRASVLEVVTASYWMFATTRGVEPVLVQVNRLLQPAYWKETAELTGRSIDEIASCSALGVEKARVLFTNMPQGQFVVYLAARKEPLVI